LKTYLSYFKLRIITNFQYRAAALAGIATQVFFGLFYLFLYIALYESNNISNAPMSLSNLITYMWLGQAFFALTHPYMKDDELVEMIKNGNLAYELIRPQSFYLKFFIKMYARRIIGVALRFLPIIVLSSCLPKPYGLSLPYSLSCFVLFLVSLFIASLLVTSLSMIVHSLIMFLLDSRGIFSFYSVIAELFMGGLVPLPFLPGVIKKIADILPFRFISDFPYRVYSGDISSSSGLYLVLFSLLWLIIIIFIGYKISQKALKKAVIQGG